MRVSCGPWGTGRGSGSGGTCRVLATFCWFACTTVTADTGCQTCFWIFILNCKPLFVAVVKRPRSGLSPAHRAPQWQLRLAVTMVSAPVPPGVRVNRELSPTGGLQAVKPKQLGSSTSPVLQVTPEKCDWGNAWAPAGKVLPPGGCDARSLPADSPVGWFSCTLNNRAATALCWPLSITGCIGENALP